MQCAFCFVVCANERAMCPKGKPKSITCGVHNMVIALLRLEFIEEYRRSVVQEFQLHRTPCLTTAFGHHRSSGVTGSRMGAQDPYRDAPPSSCGGRWTNATPGETTSRRSSWSHGSATDISICVCPSE
ncbi:hypothetical protein DPEC_G00057840 [Dallia pectoralis]|uniref:Uncharacterized protein n=1 Tax=Dallia pectoralis TaxID=75939 RepID=A0ACC2H693_DALPE|nr:hypothetical protein DPEC_G00057840 [Dallia pectoralis]